MNRQKTNWIIDAVLAAGFWLAFFLDLTGLAAHQWLGMAVGALAAYHLVKHWDWITSVTRRFVGRTSRRARLFYLLDLGLLLGLALIISSGVVISTWLALPLDNYTAWKNFHVAASIAALLLLALKLALHWRWIALVARQPLFSPPTRAPRPVPGSAGPDRREFLKWMGVMSAAGLLAIGSALKDSSSLLASELRAPAPTAPSTTTTSAASSCQVRCNRRCSYPGRCRRYIDTNGNNRCDLGECMG